MKEVICICCPKGCRLQVDDQHDYAVTGNSCSRGAEYGKNELLHPVRTVTATVALKSSALPRLPVKTAMRNITFSAPITGVSAYRCCSFDRGMVFFTLKFLANLNDKLRENLVCCLAMN